MTMQSCVETHQQFVISDSKMIQTVLKILHSYVF